MVKTVISPTTTITAVGTVITYQFVATNTGNQTLTAVNITDAQTAPASALTTGPSCVALTVPAALAACPDFV